MMQFRNLKISVRLIGGFILTTLVLVLLVGYIYFQIQYLGTLEKLNAARAEQAIHASEAKGDAAELYMVIANAELALDFQQTQKDWDTAKKMTSKDLDAVIQDANTADKKEGVTLASNNYKQIATKFETILLPALKASKASTQETLGIDAQISGYLKTMQKHLDEYNSLLQAERTQGDLDLAAARQNVLVVSLMIGLIGAILSLALGIYISLSITRPLRMVVNAAKGIAEGNLDQHLAIESKDEMGALSAAFSQMVAYLQMMANASEKISSGDLTVQVAVQSDKDVLGNSFAQMVDNLRSLVAALIENAGSLEKAAQHLGDSAGQAGLATRQIATTIQQVAKGINQQTESISKTASSAEQMGRAIDGVARGAQDQADSVSKAASITSQISSAIQQVAAIAEASAAGASDAADTARSGADTVEETIRGMERIKTRVGLSAEKVQEMGRRSEQIGAIVETIGDIASQTNLLALNAAIEAARAGEHGKGFSVVADEVRKLAERSSTATKEIGSLIKGIQKTVSEAVSAMQDGAVEVENGVQRANQSEAALASILSSAESVQKQVEEIAQAAKAISSSSNELVAAMDSVSAVVEENTAATEEMAASSSEVTEAVESIASVSEENSAAVEEVSAGTEEMSAQVEEVSTAVQSLAEMAQSLQEAIRRFKID